MGRILSIKISKLELDKGFIPYNYIMVEAEKTAEGKKSKHGIVVGFDEDATFYSEEENANIAHEADIAQVCAPVYKVPRKLYFNKENHIGSMSWDCDMDIKKGDIVWYPPIESRNATAIECDNKYFKLIPYQDIFCAKRLHKIETEYFVSNNEPSYNNYKYYYPQGRTVKEEYEVICLNGYVLLEQVFHKNKSALAISEVGDVDKTRGIVRYVGKPNREYLHPAYVDFPNLEVGDEVLLAPGSPLFLLERTKALSEFDGDKLFWVVQARRISMVLSKGN